MSIMPRESIISEFEPGIPKKDLVAVDSTIHDEKTAIAMCYAQTVTDFINRELIYGSSNQAEHFEQTPSGEAQNGNATQRLRETRIDMNLLLPEPRRWKEDGEKYEAVRGELARYYKAGNCQERSALAYTFLHQLLPPGFDVELNTIKMDDMRHVCPKITWEGCQDPVRAEAWTLDSRACLESHYWGNPALYEPKEQFSENIDQSYRITTENQGRSLLTDAHALLLEHGKQFAVEYLPASSSLHGFTEEQRSYLNATNRYPLEFGGGEPTSMPRTSPFAKPFQEHFASHDYQYNGKNIRTLMQERSISAQDMLTPAPRLFTETEQGATHLCDPGTMKLSNYPPNPRSQFQAKHNRENFFNQFVNSRHSREIKINEKEAFWSSDQPPTTNMENVSQNLEDGCIRYQTISDGQRQNWRVEASDFPVDKQSDALHIFQSHVGYPPPQWSCKENIVELRNTVKSLQALGKSQDNRTTGNER
jgi:hypothetical protein